MTYKGHYITKTWPSGYYETYLQSEGRFVKADTLGGIKQRITRSLTTAIGETT